MNLNPYVTPYTKINSERIIRAKGMQFLEKNIDVKIFVMLDYVMVS